MQFLLISNNDFDGGGQHAVKLSKNFSSLGIKNNFIMLHKKNNFNNFFLLKRNLYLRCKSFLLDLAKKRLNDLFSFDNPTVEVQEIEKWINKSDVIIIFDYHKIFSLNYLKKFLKRKIIYFRPLDIQLASGGCHNNYIELNNVCSKLNKNCENCPKLWIFKNLPRIIKKNKKSFFKENKLKVFVENSITEKIYKNSKNFYNYSIKKLFLDINIQRQKFFSKKISRDFFCLKKKEKIIIFGSLNLDTPHKGGFLLQNILKIFERFYYNSKFSGTNVRLVTFGNKRNFNFQSSLISWSHLGVLKSDHSLNKLYRSADLLVCPSVYDNGPHMIAEAFLNKLPVVCFNQGIAIDLIVNGMNGFKINKFDKFLFAKKIYKSLFLHKFNFNYQQLSQLKKKLLPGSEAKFFINEAKKDLNLN